MNDQLLPAIAALGPIWAIDPLWARSALETMQHVDLPSHRARFRDGQVLVLTTGEHVQAAGDIPEIRGAADWYGVHNGRRVQNEDGSRKPYPMDSGVALLAIEGPTSKEDSSFSEGTSTVRARRTVRMAKVDPDVKSVLMRFDTPGGTVAGCDDFAADVKALAAVKPTYAYCEDLCASAGYYVASQCNLIYANRSARIGSINTYLTVYDLSELFAKNGIKTHNVAGEDAPYKGLGTPGTPLTDEQKEYLQTLVSGYANQFKAAVKAGRGMSDDQIKQVSDGRTFAATQARSLGLIDGVTSYDAVLAKLKTYRPGATTT